MANSNHLNVTDSVYPTTTKQIVGINKAEKKQPILPILYLILLQETTSQILLVHLSQVG